MSLLTREYSFKGLWQKPGVYELLLGVLTFVVYAGCFAFRFVYDDHVLLTGAVTRWADVAGSALRPLWGDTSFSTSYYRPASTAWGQLSRIVFDVNPLPWHVSAVLLHIVTCLLVFWLALRLLGGNREMSMLAALIFALHPAHIECVAWASAFPDTLLAIFFVACLLCYIRWREQGGWVWLTTAVFLGFLAACSKEPGVVLPAVIFAYAWIFAKQTARQLARLGLAARDALLFAIGPAVYALMHKVAFSSGTQTPAAHASATAAIFTAPKLLLFYFGHLVWPIHLSAIYSLRRLQGPNWRGFFFPLFVLLALAALLTWFFRRQPQARTALFSAVLAFATLAPVFCIQYLPADNYVHDRYLYLPLAGFALIAAIALTWAAQEAGRRMAFVRPQILAVGLAVILIVANVSQQKPWSSDILLWTNVLKYAPQNTDAMSNLAAALGEQGRHDLAIAIFQQVLAQHPRDSKTYYNLGIAYFHQGQMDTARSYLERVLEADPRNQGALLYLGGIDFKTGGIDEAEAKFGRAISIDPRFLGIHAAMAAVLEKRGDLNGAAHELALELQNDPGNQVAQAELNRLRPAISQ